MESGSIPVPRWSRRHALITPWQRAAETMAMRSVPTPAHRTMDDKLTNRRPIVIDQATDFSREVRDTISGWMRLPKVSMPSTKSSKVSIRPLVPGTVAASSSSLATVA